MLVDSRRHDSCDRTTPFGDLDDLAVSYALEVSTEAAAELTNTDTGHVAAVPGNEDTLSPAFVAPLEWQAAFGYVRHIDVEGVWRELVFGSHREAEELVAEVRFP